MKKLREIARVHIARCEAGDMQAIKELANRLDGRPAPILEHSGPDSEPITKIVREFGHVHETREEILAAEEPVLIEWSGVRDANGSGERTPRARNADDDKMRRHQSWGSRADDARSLPARRRRHARSRARPYTLGRGRPV
jgi:hypothetical protein